MYDPPHYGSLSEWLMIYYFMNDIKMLFFKNCIFQECALWLMQAAGSTTNILPPSVETADACLWDMVHGVGKSIAPDANEGAQKVAKEE